MTFFFMNTVPKTAVFKKKKEEILQGAVDTAGFLNLKKYISLLFSVCMTWEIYLMKKKNVAVQRLRNTDGGWSFSAGICQGIPTHSETPKRLHTQSNTRTRTRIPCSPSLFLEITQKPRVVLDTFPGYYIEKQIFFLVIFVSPFAALFLQKGRRVSELKGTNVARLADGEWDILAV